MSESFTFCVSAQEATSRIDTFLREKTELTRTAIQALIDQGAVLVNGVPPAKNYKLRVGDTVLCTLPAPVQLDVLPQEISLEIVYEDDCLLVVNKPKGMVVHPAPGHTDGTLVNALLYHCQGRLSAINGVIRPGIVHRIDRDTSGLLVVAKEDRAHLSLAEQIASHAFERCYQAVVHGNFAQREGVVNRPIGRHPIDRKKMAIVQDGKEAITHYRVLTAYRDFSHLELQLKTGRTHQIRVHMASLSHPVVGDSVYGRTNHSFDMRCASFLQGQFLHAKTISFAHPKTGQRMHFDSPLPDYFCAILEKLKGTEYETTL